MSPRNKKYENSKSKISFNWRFRPPTKIQITNALKLEIKKSVKLEKKLSLNDKIFERLIEHFPQLPNPKNEMDWLVQYHEIGQSCMNFFKEAPIDESKEKFIYYIQMGDFNNTNLKFSDLVNYGQVFFGNNSIKLMPKKIVINIDNRKNSITAQYENVTKKLISRFKNNKYQIQAQSLFSLLKRIKPMDSNCLIAFTDIDLYSEESDLFVAGLCDGQMRVGTFSCYRYNPCLKYSEEKWYESKIGNNKLKSKKLSNLLLLRSSKLLVHETCHLLGIDHCVFFDCCMNGSGHLDEDFRQSMFLCPIDLKKLWMIFEFDIKQRYLDMLDFFEKHNCEEELNKLRKIINLSDNL
jgi:predicted Zn-dependent protease